MRFENDFYRVVHLEAKDGGGGFHAEVELIYPHRIYEGHFPGQPVVPGVCTLTMIRELVRGYFAAPVFFRSIKECKFVSALIPVSGLRVALDVETHPGQPLKCVVRNDAGVVLKLKAEIKKLEQ